jgi:hypothetical protein
MWDTSLTHCDVLQEKWHAAERTVRQVRCNPRLGANQGRNSVNVRVNALDASQSAF